jgi:hypothetical protein
MRAKKTGGRYVLRFDPGDKLVASLEEFCRKRKIGSASLSGIGSCRRARLGFFDTARRAYRFRIFPGGHEIAALLGNVSLKDGRPFVHVHAVLGGPDFRAVAGHLAEAEVLAAAEVILVPLPGRLVRTADPEAGTFPLDWKRAGRTGVRRVRNPLQ